MATHMQYLTFRCPGCDRRIGFPTTHAGIPVLCPKCQARVMVPEKDGGESFLVGALADAHPGTAPRKFPAQDDAVAGPGQQAATHALRFHRWKRTAQRLRVAVRRLPWWQTGLIAVSCVAALAFSGYIIVGEFSREWEAREKANRQARLPDAPRRSRSAPEEAQPERSRSQPQAKEPVAETPAKDREANGGEAESFQIATRDEQVAQSFDPTRLFNLESSPPSAKAADESESAPEPPPVRPPPLPSAKAAVPDEPADSVLKLLEKSGGKEEDRPAPEATVVPDRANGAEPPAQPLPPAPVVAVELPAVCPDCQGTTFVPLPSYRPYVWDYKDPAPDPAAAVPFLPCPKCQRSVDPRTAVAAEAERMKNAPATINEWTRKLNARLECGETRHVSVVAQLQAPALKGLLQQLDRLTQHVQTTFRSVLLAQTRPDTHRLIVVWDRADYDRLIDVLAAERPEQDWALARRASGRVGRTFSFFNAQRGLGTPVENLAVFQFAHMLILEGTDGKAADWLVEGFASHCENAVLRKNLCYAFRYAPNEVRLATNWNAEMARHARQGQLVSWDRILKLDLIGMKPLDYLSCYSMVRFLATEPTRFNALLVNIRAGVDSQRAIEHAYGRPLDDLQKLWVSWARQQR